MISTAEILGLGGLALRGHAPRENFEMIDAIYNIDLLKIQRNAHFNEFFDNLISCGFFLKITLPTRIAGQSASLIDNIFSSNL